jgi:hypothetical protein
MIDHASKPKAMMSAMLLSMVLSHPAVAQQTPLPLDPSCTVTVGNQSAAVGADGIFLLQNIPIFQPTATGASPQLFRVRATCLRDGRMVTGQSRLFTLTRGQTTIVKEIFPTALDPVPIGLQVTAPETFILPGADVQLSVTGRYLDGSSRDLTARSTGTAYVAANPGLLQVTEEGLVTSVNSGDHNQSALITVLNDGNTATILFTAVANPNDFDGDGLPNDYEDLFGLDKFSHDAFGDFDGDGLTNLQEFQVGTLPNDRDTDLDGLIDGLDSRPLDPESDPPVATITSPAGGGPLIAGQTVRFAATATDDGRVASVELRVNGASLATLTQPPYETVFNVPFAATRLTFEARATDSSGKSASAEPVTLGIVPDPRTTVVGRVQDRDGTPVAGAAVFLRLHGLKSEFFDFATPLSALPDLTGLTPGAARLVPDLGFRNPQDLLAPDTFGLPFAPDFAGRFTGFLRLENFDFYTLTLGADDGARLLLAGRPVLEVPPAAGFQEATTTLFLSRGVYPIEVDYFQSVGGAELTLAIGGSRGGGETLTAKALGSPDVDLRLDPSPFTATTAADGTFSFSNVPSILGPIGAGVEVTLDDLPRTGSANEAPAATGGETDLGTIVLDPEPACITGRVFYSQCLSGPVTDPLDLYEEDPYTGQLSLVGRITPDATGRFCLLPRRNRFYILRKEDVECFGQVAVCQAFLFLNNPTAAGICGQEGARCQDNGDVGLSCSFIGS